MAYARNLPCVCFLFLALGFYPLRGEDPFPALWQEAEARRLWDHPGWWTLGHYHRTMWLRVESRLDDPAFFLAPNGKTSRKAELRATLRAFTEADPSLEEEGGGRVLACRFPARRRWLAETLGVQEEAFGSPDCDTYHRVLVQLMLTRAAVVYPSAYMNSPASMYGHLLLVIDREDMSRLLSRAVNYAAVVGDSFGPLFAFKGIFGLYEGVFAILPYFEKVEEYSAVNRRDIWEYPLDLDADEFDRMMRHVWELQNLRSRYFFFKENCAFNMLYPVEAARPSIALTRRFRTHAIPVTILRELQESGITGEPVYRPSKTSQLAHLATFLDAAEQRRALALARGEDGPAPDEQPVVLSLAVEITQFFYTEKKLSPEEYRERVFPLLQARSRRGRVELPPVPVPDPPHLAHAPRRLFVYGGTDQDGEEVLGIRARVAYHGWLDVPAAMAPGSHITMFEAEARADRGFERWSLRDLTLVEIRSLSPYTLWAKPLSWAALFRVEEDPFRDHHHRGVVSFASGRAWSPTARTLLHLLFDNTLLLDNRFTDSVAWEPGLQAGIAYAGDRLRAGVQVHSRKGLFGSSATRHHGQAELRWALTPDLSVGLRLHLREEDGDTFREQLGTVSWTF